MVRRVIQIDEEKCNGCGICAEACHEGAIGIVDGKAKLLRDDYCDGLGDCLPNCPVGAISFIEREAAAYDEAAVQENKKKKCRRWDRHRLADARVQECASLKENLQKKIRMQVHRSAPNCVSGRYRSNLHRSMRLILTGQNF